MTTKYRLPMQRDVALFHQVFDMPDRILTPGPLPKNRRKLRIGLITEEGLDELRASIKIGDPRTSAIETVDSLIDTIYVALGAAVEMGNDLLPNIRYLLGRESLAAERFINRMYGRGSDRGALTLKNAYQDFEPLVKEQFTNETQAALALQMWVAGEMSGAGINKNRVHERNQIRRINSKLGNLNRAFTTGNQKLAVKLLAQIIMDCLRVLTLLGVDAQPFFDEVQRANMSKLGADGKPIHSRGIELDGFPAGKTLKGPNYRAPDLAAVYQRLYGAAQA